MYGRDFWTEGRSMENLGLAGMKAKQILEYLSQSDQSAA